MPATEYGPKNAFCSDLHRVKYRLDGESFDDFCHRVSNALADSKEHCKTLLSALRLQAWLPAGRQQLAVGSPHKVTPFNCFMSGVVNDSWEGENGIAASAMRCGSTMRMGGGIGINFSTIRPDGNIIKSSEAPASGPVSFMNIWDAVCSTIQSRGLRRGAMMGILSVDHPDILQFVRAKTRQGYLTNFNLSVAVTDEFMQAVKKDELFQLRFEGKPYTIVNGQTKPYPKVRAKELWDEIMTTTWDWSEPGVIFIDTMNQMNPLNYCEEIIGTNPCGEIPLPANGACLLGSMNCTAYLVDDGGLCPDFSFDWDRFSRDISAVVRATDNIIDMSHYPLKEQEIEVKQKRRMGVGLTGISNTVELLGYPYASEEYVLMQDRFLCCLRDVAYRTSIDLAREKGSFPLFDAEFWLESGYAQTLPESIREGVRKYGLRNGVLLSIAPTGTISLCADNISSGVEPTFALEYERDVNLPGGKRTIQMRDWALERHGIACTKAEDVPVADHVRVLCAAQKYVDSSVSKTCNVGDKVTFSEFKKVYMQAYDGGAKGCTTFRASGKRAGILRANKTDEEEEGGACYIDLETGLRSCG